MFASQRSGSDAVWPLLAVALVLSGWLAGTGLLLKAYRDGGVAELRNQCELVCRGGGAPATHS